MHRLVFDGSCRTTVLSAARVERYQVAMPSSSKLKVYRTPIGFHDAYVAATSQKAALEAWGSDTNLFAQKTAELVTDPGLTAEPLASPGIVVKRLRGTAAEQIAALGPDSSKSNRKTPDAGQIASKPIPKPKARPRPDRSSLAAAEEAIGKAENRQAREIKVLLDQERALERQRRDLEQVHRDQRKALEEAKCEAEAKFENAMKRWRADYD